VAPLLNCDVEYLGELTTDEKYALLGGATALHNPTRNATASPYGPDTTEAAEPRPTNRPPTAPWSRPVAVRATFTSE
jgi:hypothetical protein